MKEHTKAQLTRFLSPVFLILVVILSTYYLIDLKPTTAFQSPTINPQIRFLYTTNTTRLDIVGTYCASTPVQILQSDRNTNSQYNSSLSTYFKANATKLVNSLFNSDISGLIRQLQVNGAGTFVFLSPYLIGLALLLLVWPFFLCCCICQDSCPAKCCRSRNPSYTSGDLNWVTVVLTLTSILLSVTAIPALTNASNFFGDFNCRASQFLDNFYNGNQTTDQKYFFSGLNTIRHQFTSVLSPALSSVSTQITRITGSPGSQIDTAKTNAASAKTSMQNMPNGGNNLQFALNYNYPLESSVHTGTLPTVLGPTIGTFSSSTTLLGDFYTFVNTIESDLSIIATAASGVNPHLTAGDMGARITATDTILGSVSSSLDGMKSSFKNIMSILSNIDSYNVKYSFALYGSIMGIGTMVIIGIILVKSFNCISCRYCLYFLCFASFLLAAIMLLFATVLAAGMSSTYYSCVYLSDTFSNPNRFTHMVTTLVGPQYSDISTYFSQCFGGTNDFITMVDPTLSGYISQLKTAVFNSAQYNFTGMTSNLNDKLSAMSTAIDNTGLGHIPDFDVTLSQGQAEIAYFKTVADKSLFTSSCTSGAFPVFYQDAWVPGHSSIYQSYVGCQGKVTQDASVCTAGIASTASCPSSRCINTFSIISMYYRGGSIANLVADANTRYGGTCTPFNNYLINFYTNYVKEVVDKIGNSGQDSADNTKLAGRYNSATKTPVQTLRDYMNTNVKPLFQQVYGNLTSTLSLDSIFNIQTGVITGLDCRLLGQSGVALKQAICIKSFNRIFFSLVVVGIMSFALFLLVCCILCFNVRHYQFYLQSKSVNKIFPLDETDSAIKME